MVKNKEKDEPINQNRVRHISEKTYAIVVKNGTKSPVSVKVQESFSQNAKILYESLPSDKLTANRFVWSVQIPAEGKSEFTYTVREEF